MIWLLFLTVLSDVVVDIAYKSRTLSNVTFESPAIMESPSSFLGPPISKKPGETLQLTLNNQLDIPLEFTLMAPLLDPNSVSVADNSTVTLSSLL